MADQNDVIRVTIIIEMPSSVIAMLVGYLFKNSTGSSDDQQAAIDYGALIATSFNANLASHTPTAVTWTRIDWAIYDSILGQWNTTAQEPIVGAVGTSGGAFADHKTAGLIKFFTGIARRQGRKYIPALDEGAMNNSILDATVITDLAFFGADYDDFKNLDGHGYQTGIWSPTLGFKTFSNTVEVNTKVAGQNRRAIGAGI